MKVIDEESEKFKLCESGQGTVEMKFAIYNKETQSVITPFCKCKDYFSDVFWTKNTGKDTVNQYGFTFKKGYDNGLLDADIFTLAITMSKSSDGKIQKLKEENLESILSLLRKFEDANNFEPSNGELCEESTHFIITFDKKWSSIPYVLSTLFLLLRMGFNYDEKSDLSVYFKNPKSFITPNDQMYLNQTLEIVQDLATGIIDTNQKWSDYENCDFTHNNSGLVGYSRKYRENKEKVKKDHPSEILETVN